MSSINDATDVLRDTDEEAVTTVLSDLFESLESADDIPTWDDGPSASAFIARPDQELDDLIPEGPFTIRLMGTVYDEVYEDLMLQLLRRGLLAGAEVWRAPRWIPFSEHPDFGAIQAQMAAEVERLVARNKPPRELTPQPHWRSPQNVRHSDEVTRPSVRLSDIEGMEFESEGLSEQTGDGLAHRSEPLEDSRKTAEFDPEPFRQFAGGKDDQRTSRVGPDEIDAALESMPPSHLTSSTNDRSEGGWEGVPDTEVSEILTLEESSEDEIATREADAPILQTERPRRERSSHSAPSASVRVRQHSPLEGTDSPRTAFPVENAEASMTEGSAAPPPGAAIINRPNRRSDGERMQQPARKKQPTAALPRAKRAPAHDESQPPAQSSVETSAPITPPSRVPTWLVYVAVIAIVVSIVAIAVVSVRYWSAHADAAPATKPTASQLALDEATARVDGAFPTSFSDERDVATVVASLAGESAQKKMWTLASLHAARPSAESALAAASASVEAGEWDEGRRLAIDALLLGASPDDARPIFAQSLQNEPVLERDARQTWEEVGGIEMVGGQLVVSRDGADWVFVPATKDEPDAHRTALAFARLCSIVTCDFEVPQTYRVTVRKRGLAGLDELKGLDADSLRWVSTSDGDVVDGAAYRIPDASTPFPIDDEPLWRSWLGVGKLEPKERAEVIALSNRVDPDRLVVQLSNLLTIDYLTNNWSRIPEADFTTTVLSDGRLVSTRHDAAFATRSSRRVEDRFAWVEKFDRRLVAELRLVTPEMIDHYLFVDGDPVWEARRDEFWSQREELLEAVEDAEKRDGEAIWL